MIGKIWIDAGFKDYEEVKAYLKQRKADMQKICEENEIEFEQENNKDVLCCIPCFHFNYENAINGKNCGNKTHFHNQEIEKIVRHTKSKTHKKSLIKFKKLIIERLEEDKRRKLYESIIEEKNNMFQKPKMDIKQPKMDIKQFFKII